MLAYEKKTLRQSRKSIMKTFQHDKACSCFALLCLVLIANCQKLGLSSALPVHNKELSIEISTEKTVKFSVEIADTLPTQERGLMFRRNLPANHGMLFIFNQLAFHPFWMKNTYIPLDLIFFDDNFNIIGLIENAKPMSEQLMTIEKPSRYVLEVLAGTVKKYGIEKNSFAHFLE
jgi:uncharacterized membrane protein (UPF0127 family)